MSSLPSKNARFKYYKSKKVKGGVGVKKQSDWVTPIRLVKWNAKLKGEHTVKSSIIDTPILSS